MDYSVPQPDHRLISDLPFRAVGGQPAFEAADLERFVSKARVAVLAYLRADQRPHQSPIWYTYRLGVFLMSTVTGSPKHKALARDPQVSLTIQDEVPPYRAVVMEGAVTLSAIHPGSDPIAGMAVRYFGRVGANEYDKLTGELYQATGLTLISFRPAVVRGFDNTNAIGRLSLAFMRLRERLPIPRGWL